MPTNNLTLGYIYGLLGVIIFGLTLPMTRIAVGELPPVFVGLGRSAVAAVLAAGYLIYTRASLPTRPQLKWLAVLPIGIIFGFPGLSAIAMTMVPASHGGVMLGILPLATTIAAFFVARERPSAAFWFWAVLGSAAIAAFSLLEGGVALHTGDLLLVAAVLLAAWGYAVSGVLARQMNPLAVISWGLVLSFPILIGVVIWVSPDINWHASPKAWGAFAYVAIFSQFLGFAFWNRGLALGGIAKVGQMQLFQLFVTLIASALMLGESLTLTLLIFAVLVTFTVAMGKNAAVVRPD